MENKKVNMRLYCQAVNYGYDKYDWSVKVPEELSFVEFISHWDMDKYIHDSIELKELAKAVCNPYGFPVCEFMVMNDYPSYSPNHCEDSLRFYFTKERYAKQFGRLIKAMLNDKIVDDYGDMSKTKRVIDVYFYGGNGFTYSYTYPDMVSATGVEDVKNIIDMDDVGTHEIYITRDLETDKETFPSASGFFSDEAEQYLNKANLTY
jgi:hypothetical protein|tara:strand:- start:230 stop:847 length:618 start_codon:yes stop_codon:yes gene_type:complete